MQEFDWKEKYKDKISTAAVAVKLIKSGNSIFIGTGCGQPQHLVGALVEHSSHIYDAHIVHLLTMGAAPYANEKFREKFKMNSFFIADNVRDAFAKGIGDYIEIPNAEMYGEHFDIPQPDELVFVSWFQGGEVFRSGCCFFRGRGKIFYFRPGHETYPIFYHEDVLKVIENAVNWAAPSGGPSPNFDHFPKPIEDVPVWEGQIEIDHPDN